MFKEFSKFGNILSSGIISTNDIYINNIDLINLNRIFLFLFITKKTLKLFAILKNFSTTLYNIFRQVLDEKWKFVGKKFQGENFACLITKG